MERDLRPRSISWPEKFEFSTGVGFSRPRKVELRPFCNKNGPLVVGPLFIFPQRKILLVLGGGVGVLPLWISKSLGVGGHPPPLPQLGKSDQANFWYTHCWVRTPPPLLSSNVSLVRGRQCPAFLGCGRWCGALTALSIDAPPPSSPTHCPPLTIVESTLFTHGSTSGQPNPKYPFSLYPPTPPPHHPIHAVCGQAL